MADLESALKVASMSAGQAKTVMAMKRLGMKRLPADQSSACGHFLSVFEAALQEVNNKLVAARTDMVKRKAEAGQEPAGGPAKRPRLELGAGKGLGKGLGKGSPD